MIKYKNAVTGLSGKLNDSLVTYESDGKWHISDVIALGSKSSHSFCPLSSNISGASIEIEYVKFYDDYDVAVAAQLDAVFNDATLLKDEQDSVEEGDKTSNNSNSSTDSIQSESSKPTDLTKDETITVPSEDATINITDTQNTDRPADNTNVETDDIAQDKNVKETDGGGSSATWTLIGIGATVVIVGVDIVLLVVFLRRKKHMNNKEDRS